MSSKLFFAFWCACFHLFTLSAGEFTISSYNCGALSDHYDYLRAVSMEQLIQERFNAEPQYMAENENIQKIALKILFSPEGQEKALAQQEWDQKQYQQIVERLVSSPSADESPNKVWNQKSEEIITTYKIRPILIHSEQMLKRLHAHLHDLTQVNVENADSLNDLLLEVRHVMAIRIFANHLPYDIICLQEADYLDASVFPANYEVVFSDAAHSINGIAWNKDKFELVETFRHLHRVMVAKLREKETGNTVIVASGHLSGCNPFKIEFDSESGKADSANGDEELRKILSILEEDDADLMLIGMDSNVTAMHPRLAILKESNFLLDYEHFLEATCTNPHHVLNTRIDWIAVKSYRLQPSIINIPVNSVGLNSMQTNISDHKPIAAKISY